MSIVVFWIDEYEIKTQSKMFSDDEFMLALSKAENLRKSGYKHVTISSELGDCVGKPGVSSVEDGKTPDGLDYEWSKQHRGGPPLSKE